MFALFEFNKNFTIIGLFEFSRNFTIIRLFRIEDFLNFSLVG